MVGSTHENLAVRMAMAAHAAEGPWPVMDPYSPDHQRLYRHAAQVWTAALMRASGAGLYPATVITVLASICAIAGGLFAALSQVRSYISGFLGSVLISHRDSSQFPRHMENPIRLAKHVTRLRPRDRKKGYSGGIHSGSWPDSCTGKRLHPNGWPERWFRRCLSCSNAR